MDQTDRMLLEPIANRVKVLKVVSDIEKYVMKVCLKMKLKQTPTETVFGQWARSFGAAECSRQSAPRFHGCLSRSRSDCLNWWDKIMVALFAHSFEVTSFLKIDPTQNSDINIKAVVHAPEAPSSHASPPTCACMLWEKIPAYFGFFMMISTWWQTNVQITHRCKPLCRTPNCPSHVWRSERKALVKLSFDHTLWW